MSRNFSSSTSSTTTTTNPSTIYLPFQCLAELQANKKHTEEQEAKLRVAAEEEQQAAEAARNAEEEWVATEKKVAKKLSKK